MNIATQTAINALNTINTMNAINTMNQTSNALLTNQIPIYSDTYSVNKRPKLDFLPLVFMYAMLNIVCLSIIIGLPFVAYNMFKNSDVAVGIIISVAWLAILCIECAVVCITKGIVDELKQEIKNRRAFDNQKCQNTEIIEKSKSLDDYVMDVMKSKSKDKIE